jgi:butyryl-CoA dehydrogenase
MMNEARLGIGMNATAIATAAFHASLDYAKVRPQGRNITDREPNRPQVPIIQHADVKRMLLVQKSITEGSLALLIFCGLLGDQVSQETDPLKKGELEALLDLLIPIAKSYPSEMGLQSTSMAIQVLGGAGYTTDFPVEQYYREARIHPIHEGTTGIHGLDLLGRKLLLHEGLGWKMLQKELEMTIQDARKLPDLADLTRAFEKYCKEFTEGSAQILFKRNQGPDYFLADATLFLDGAGILCMGWMWLKQAITAQRALDQGTKEQDFHLGKIETARFTMEYELVKLKGLLERFASTSYPSIAMKTEWF